MKFLSIIIFLLFPSFVFGEWTVVSGNPSKGSYIYVNFQKIIQKNNSTYFWYLMDFEEKQYLKSRKFNGFHSFIIRGQGECDLFRFRDLQFNLYKSRMGKDFIFNFEPDGKWKHPTPGSNYDSMLESVCKK